MDELEQITTRYLLGELSEQEQAALEKRYFSDPQVFNEVLRAESELGDAYARGQLSAEMRERFEHSYLKHPSRRQRVEFARALTTRIDERARSATRVEQPALHISWKQRLLATVGGQRPALRFAMALVILLIALAGVWIFVDSRWRQQQREAAQKQPAETPQQTEKQQGQEERAAQIPPETSKPSPNPNTNSAPSTVSLALTIGSVRSADSGSTQTLLIPHGTTQAQISLELKDDSYPRYRVSLRQIGGPEIFTQTNIRPRSTKAGARFVFKIPANRLISGDYALTLGGITPEGDVDDLNKSLFRVEKR
jgi:type II secretory pathway pseudopilin PulG